MASKIAVVTGANKGIGYGITKTLCEQFKGIVYLTSRDNDRGKAAVENLNKLNLKPEFHQLDIEDEKSIKTFANFIKEKHGGIDVLVNNAAIAIDDIDEPVGKKAELTLKTNYFALLKLCENLFPLLRPHARVVNISSSAGHLLRIPGKDLRKKLADPMLKIDDLSNCMNSFIEAAKRGDHEKEGWPNSTYVVSKVGVSALSRIQQKQFLNDSREDIIVNHVHPGYVDTDMTKHRGKLTIEEGADAPTYLALLPEGVDSPKGEYVWFTRQIVDWVNGPTPEKA